jgi:ribosomal protein S18 acetylase RimI-like enzyme
MAGIWNTERYSSRHRADIRNPDRQRPRATRTIITVMSDFSRRIARGGAERIADLEPLYLVLHEHHATVSPLLAGMEARDPGESWSRRRARYEQWLSTPGSFVLIAEEGERAIGYAVVSLGDGSQGWGSGERVGDVHDLAVLPEARRRQVGSELMDEVERELLRAGVGECRLKVIPANADAIHFYERRGMLAVAHVYMRSIGKARATDLPARHSHRDLDAS